MIIKKFQAKTEEAALELARKELGSGIVVMNVKKVKKKGLFSIFKPQQVEVTVALEEEEKQNFREAVAKVSEIARQSEAAGNTRSAKTEPERPAKQGKAEPGSQPEKQRQQEKQRQPEKNTQTIDSRQESAIEEKLSTLQNLLEKQISDVQDKEKDSMEEEKKEDSNVAFFHLLYKMLLDNEIEETYANQLVEELDGSVKPDMPIDYLLSVVYQKMVLKFGQTKTIQSAEKGPKLVYFIGPTGVGKTELSKALAEAVFGTEQALIRVDMSEYMEKHSVSKLIGSPPGYVGYEEGGQLSEKVRRNPYSVILFDEIEKAHPDVFNILLQVLDDGHITDAQGRKVDFKQTCIIMTSNAGAQNIVAPKRLGFLSEEDERKDYEYMKGQVMEEVKRMFKPEFLNRIDEIIVFHQLTKADTKKILQILLKDLERRCREQMDIELKVRDTVKEYLVENSFDSKYGARPLKRAIQSKIEDPLAEAILNGTVKKGDTVAAGMSKKEITFKVLEKNKNS